MMLSISSNIAGIIRQTERLKESIPEAMNRALAPEQWIDLARDTALRVLTAIAQPAERVFVPDFVATVTGAILPGQNDGLSLKMITPFATLRDLIADAQSARAVASPFDQGTGLFQGQISEFEALIQQWVETPEADGGKRRDSRDLNKTDEEIAQLISYIMLSPNIGFKGFIARMKLTPHIEAFIQKQQGLRLDPATVDAWLRTVLEAWRQMINLHYLAKVKVELNRMSRELL
jgi:hypothetical protein